jgi:uncharacterized protein
MIETNSGWVGIGFRQPLRHWIATRPSEIQCLEITAEHFFDGSLDYLRDLRKEYPLFVHGLGLSLGTPDPIDRKTLAAFNQVVEAADPEWISEHVAFTRSNEVDLGHLNPIQPNASALETVASHAQEVAQYCSKPIILENITTHLRLRGELSEPEFLNQLCQKADCGLLLDVTNLFINARNHHFDAKAWLHELDPERIVQLHVVGYMERDGRLIDSHSEDIQEDLWELIHATLDHAKVRAVIVERDGNFPQTDTLARELKSLSDALRQH